MKKQSLAIQIALFVGAIAFGMLLSHLLFQSSGSLVGERGNLSSGERAAKADRPIAAGGDSAGTRTTSEKPEVLASADPATRARSLESILAERKPRERLRDLQAFINTLTPAGYADALKRIRQLTSSNERELASRLLVARWVQDDPDGALQFAAGNRGFEYVAEDVFQHFAASDFDAAMNRAQAITGGDLRHRAVRGVLMFKADTDPQAALALAAKLGDFRGGEPLASTIYRQWAASDPQAAALHAAQNQTGEGGWGSPVGPVVDTWARQDPLAAANWSLAQKDPEAQTRSVSQVMRQWARDDPNAVANWIHGLEYGVSRDAAVAGLAQALASRDPQTALDWTGTIADQAMRNRTLQRLSGVIMWRDPQNGAAMLQAAGLPAEQIRDYRRRRDASP